VPYTLPNFNLVCQVKANFNFALGLNPVAPFVFPNTPCNLAYSRRAHVPVPTTTSIQAGELMYLLLPVGIAIKGKGSYAVKNGDAIEVPQGSGRWYSCLSIDKVAAGFTNEHQSAVICQPYLLTGAAPLWP